MIPEKYRERVEDFFRKEYSPDKEILWRKCLFEPSDCRIGECPIAVFGEEAVSKIKPNESEGFLCGEPFFVTKRRMFPTSLKHLKRKDIEELKSNLSYIVIIDDFPVILEGEKDKKAIIGYYQLKESDLKEIERFFNLYQIYRGLPLKEKKKLWSGGRNPEEDDIYVMECREFGIDEDCELIFRESRFIEIYYALEKLDKVVEG